MCYNLLRINIFREKTLKTKLPQKKNRLSEVYREKKKSAQGGFSLIELIIVIAIVATLSGLLLTSFMGSAARKRVQTCRHNREAILSVFQRCVYETSDSIELTTDDLNKLIKVDPTGNDATRSSGYSAIDSELSPYLHCPTFGEHEQLTDGIWVASIDDSTHTAIIKCTECGASGYDNEDTMESVVVADMIALNLAPTPTPDTDNPITKPTPTPSPEAEKRYNVYFEMHGHGIAPAPQTNIKEGDKATKPSNPKASMYDFCGWFEDVAFSKPFDFDTPITHNYTLHAKWEGIQLGKVWPYAEDLSWWNAEDLAKYHAGEYRAANLAGNSNEMWIDIKAPSGIFTSLAGKQFVVVGQNQNGSDGSQKINLSEAASPEIYATDASKQWLVPLSGNVKEIDITNAASGSQYRMSQSSPGDLFVFVDKNRKKIYEYVFWHRGGIEDPILDLDKIIAYNVDKIGNVYRVNETPSDYDED